MPSLLDLRLCQEDAPAFRKQLGENEESIAALETTMKALIKLAKAGVELANELSAKQSQLAAELTNFSNQDGDPIVVTALQKFSKSIADVERSRNMLQSHIRDMFIEPMEKFVREEIGPVKDMRKRFEKASDEVDGALNRYMAKKTKDTNIEEAAAELAIARKDLHARSLEYSIKMNDLQARKKFEFMEFILAYMYTDSAFYHQSYEFLRELDPYMRDLTGLLQDSRQRHDEDTQDNILFQNACANRKLSSYNPLSTADESTEAVEDIANATNQLSSPKSSQKSGYLYKRNSGRVMQTWTKRFFSVEGENLVCAPARLSKFSREEEPESSINLRVCTIKAAPNADRRNCFEVISPMKVFTLQAENEKSMMDWIQQLKSANQAALNFPKAHGSEHEDGHHTQQNATNTASNSELLKQVIKMQGNECCADCNSPDPQWASINLGITLCIECSGIHRSLGVHVSKVRSLTLDRWEIETIEIMLQLGNIRANDVFLTSSSQSQFQPITSESTRSEKAAYITEKYVTKSFVTLPDEAESMAVALWSAVEETNLVEILRQLALGANINFRNEDEGGCTPLHLAIKRSDDICTEFLLQWFCDPNITDDNGWTALHHAVQLNNSRLVLTLLKRHAKADFQDKDGKTPLDIAVELQHVQSVTILRLFAFDRSQNGSPGANSDFGFREAMSSFAIQNATFRNSHPASQSNVDLRASVPKPILLDDQNANLLRRSDPKDRICLLGLLFVSSVSFFTSLNMERTYIMVKPDGVERGLVGEIIKRFENRGYQLLALQLLTPTKEHLEQHYADLKAKPFFPGLIQYMLSGPVVGMVWAGKDAVKTGRKMLGETNPLASAPGTIRGDYCIEVGRNICHGSDSVESAEKEIALWFPQGVADYQRNKSLTQLIYEN
ncbi:hypothetical protein BZG36_02187 [Bifiguratus adelaidae]|uniref:Nucleoside diphosphate kinase n=1 Tax=Bifiguratus adelaidae TaxID=1938954 RepID=A0A261Y0S2_9FUNG|nr:hypothetical protein BZG36_02187 [Bifiguratus adelaidae]